MKNRTTVIFIVVAALLLVFNIVTFSALMVIQGDLKEREIITDSVVDDLIKSLYSRIEDNAAWIDKISKRPTYYDPCECVEND